MNIIHTKINHIYSKLVNSYYDNTMILIKVFLCIKRYSARLSFHQFRKIVIYRDRAPNKQFDSVLVESLVTTSRCNYFPSCLVDMGYGFFDINTMSLRSYIQRIFHGNLKCHRSYYNDLQHAICFFLYLKLKIAVETVIQRSND